LGHRVDHRLRNYWVVSPNVDNKPGTVPEWKRLSLRWHAAFMGYPPNGKSIGRRFARDIHEGDIILIARQKEKKPDAVAFGLVLDDKCERRANWPRSRFPDESYGADSVRVLKPFVEMAPGFPFPRSLPILSALRHKMALARLHPDRNPKHKQVCQWMWQQLSRKSKECSRTYSWLKTQPPHDVPSQAAPETALPTKKRDYEYQTPREERHARQREQKLVVRYENWLAGQGRKLVTTRLPGNIQCDAIDRRRRNLIEAKSSDAREFIRMAVGELSDYAFRLEVDYGYLNQAILVPRKPKPDIEEWLSSIKVSLIWPRRGRFEDNAGGRFT